MTTLWKPDGSWAGETVAILGSAPGMCQELADAVSQQADRVIAVNRTCELAPMADMLVALDYPWPQEYRDFPGLRVIGVEAKDVDALYIGHVFERVTVLGSNLEIRNSGLAAIRMAAGMGAARIILAGFEPGVPRAWYDDEVDHGEYIGVAAGLEAICAELAAQGVKVERVPCPQE